MFRWIKHEKVERTVGTPHHSNHCSRVSVVLQKDWRQGAFRTRSPRGAPRPAGLLATRALEPAVAGELEAESVAKVNAATVPRCSATRVLAFEEVFFKPGRQCLACGQERPFEVRNLAS